MKKVSIPIPEDLHREIKIASTMREQTIMDLLRLAWSAFKKQEGKRIHERVGAKETANAG